MWSIITLLCCIKAVVHLTSGLVCHATEKKFLLFFLQNTDTEVFKQKKNSEHYLLTPNKNETNQLNMKNELAWSLENKEKV